MKVSVLCLPFLLAHAVTLAGCGGATTGSGGVPVVPVQNLEFEGTSTGGGDGDALAATILWTTGRAGPRPRLNYVMAGTLGDDLARLARRHLITQAWGGSGGARLVGSKRIRDLAQAAGAPKDSNQNGSNLDETLAEDLAQLGDLAGATVDPLLNPIMFPWNSGDARYTAPIHVANPSPAQPTIEPNHQLVNAAQVGRSMRARTLMAAELLQNNRGSRPGATGDDGLLGLLLLQQVVAAEETLLASAVFDGRALSSLPEPRDYDPKQGLRWLPARFRVVGDQNHPKVPAAYEVVDRASDLESLAEVLDAATELAWWASDLNPNPNLRDVLRGHPFGSGATGGPGRPTDPPLRAVAAAAEVTWDGEVGALLGFRCGACHGSQQPNAGFQVITYESTLRGGNNSGANSQTPIIVKGDHRKSLIWQVLVGPTSVARQMPQGGPFLPQSEIDIVADWIDQGALKSPTKQPEPIRIGTDLAVVQVRNLRAMHMTSSGALHHRHEGDQPSNWVDSGATGRALMALANALPVLTTEPQLKDTLQKAAEFALATLTDNEGRVVQGYDLGSGQPEGRATLGAHANMTAGLLAAARVLQNNAMLIRGRLLADQFLKDYRDNALLRSDLRRRGKLYTPLVIASVMEAFAEAIPALGSGADLLVGTQELFLQRIRPHLVYSEVDGNELLGDGVPDTDGNRIPEPALAGDEHGRASVFAGRIMSPPSLAEEILPEPVLWSRDVLPLFQRTCAGCHVNGAQRGLYRVDTPTMARTPGESNGRFRLIVPGKPEESLLYRKLVDRTPPIGEQMPLQTPPLDSRGKALVRQWIQEGARGR